MYYLCKESGKWCIRYWENGKNKRLPIKKYRNIRENQSELQQFILRLNHQILTKTAIDFRHAYINESLLAEYLNYLCQIIPNQENAKTEYYYLVNYALNFYICHKNVINPLEWPNYQGEWGKYLESNKCPKSAKTKRYIVQALNRFCLWLQEKRPLEITRQLTFKPISKAKYKMIEAIREMNGEKVDHKTISEHHWKTISELTHWEIRPHIMLAYLYGLRRSEILAIRLEDIKTDCLSIERQLIDLKPTYGPLKGRKKRFVPHYFCTPADCYSYIKSMKVIHPDTLTDKWAERMKLLELNYRFHDLRHTWVTNCWKIPGLLPKQIQDAAGHENIETTMRYTHSDRTLGKIIFKP